ncbi:MAG: PH domain-containing protein [Oscillospiraceae bacterium]|nr:PH domain-containing protein [Oscillospiraceae bacterium]MDD4545842.1 PH domain-containing protein [Oscillospiraceae bacterium]
MEKEIRNHFSITFLNTLKSTWFFLVLFVFDFIPDAEDVSTPGGYPVSPLFLPILLIAAAIIVFIFQVIRWRKTYILIKDGQIIIDRRYKIMKNKTTVKISSISSVNLKQNILERVLNVYSIQLDINSAVTADKTDFHLVFGQKDATEFQKLITDLKQEARLQTSTANDPAESTQTGYLPVVSFPLLRVIRHCLLSISVTGMLLTLSVFTGVFTAAFFAGGDFAAEIGWASSSILAIILIIWQTLAPFLRYYKFTVIKQNNKVVISYGLLTKQQYTLPLDKTSALIIRQSLLSRIAHLYYGELINIGMGDEERKENPVFCLLVNKQELETIIEQVAPAFIFSESINPSPTPALLSVLIKYTLIGLPVLVAAIVVGYWWAGCLWLALVLLAGFASFKTKGLGLQNNNIAVTQGVFAKKTLITTYSRIQNIAITDGPFSRRFGLCKGNITILAGTMNKNHSTGYFQSDKFDHVCSKMIEHQSISLI